MVDSLDLQATAHHPVGKGTHHFFMSSPLTIAKYPPGKQVFIIK